MHCSCGAGFLEAVYNEALQYELDDIGIQYESEKELDVWYKKRKLRKKYIAGFMCFDKIIVEIKVLETLTDEHTAHVLNYHNAAKLRLGLLINFGSLKMQIKRVIL